MRELIESELLDALDQLEGQRFKEPVWRVSWASRDPLAGSVVGGRWTPGNSFEALYLSLSKDGAIAEVHYRLSRAPVMSSSHKLIHEIEANLHSVLVLDAEALQRIGVDDPKATRVDYNVTQPVGEAAHMLDYQGIVVPGARWDCMNLVVFLDRIDLNTELKVVETSEFNWPAWIAQNG